MRFVGALDAILAFAVAWKLLGHFENTSWHKPTNCRVDDNDISNFEFVGRHRCLAFSWADTAGSHPNSVDVSLIGAHATRLLQGAPTRRRMVEPSSRHPTIPSACAAAFRDAVWRYSHWLAEPEPEVSLDLKPASISTVCRDVLPFNDPLPEDVFGKLFSHLHAEHTILKGELDSDPTYATAARCFLKLIEHRKAEYQRREET
jgi:hypothetical protein